MWNGRRYHSLDSYLKETFGEKLYKLTLDAGMTCPNRDGTLGTGGCCFCSGEGSGDFAAGPAGELEAQLANARAAVADKFSGSRYIAYFQSYTNTYAPAGRLRELFFPVIRREEIAVLDIATRPDCLPEETLSLLSELAATKPVWVELGLQTMHDETARRMNRCYPTKVYDEAVRRLHEAGVQHVITHMILGLPGETEADMLATARHIADCGSDGIKLQLLHILQGTPLSGLYAAGAFAALEQEEYVHLVAKIIGILPPDMVVHRLTGDGDREKLIAPRWSLDKRRVLNAINHELKIHTIIQGCNICLCD